MTLALAPVPLAGVAPSDDVGAVPAHLLGVEGPRRAGQPLHDQPGVLVRQDRHQALLPVAVAASATILRAPSAMSSADVRARPDSWSIFLPSPTFVPPRRTTSGTFNPPGLSAAIAPAAMVSHFMMPPKIFPKMPRTQ